MAQIQRFPTSNGRLFFKNRFTKLEPGLNRSAKKLSFKLYKTLKQSLCYWDSYHKSTEGYDKCAAKGKVTFVSAYGIHQLHIFIFVLTVVYVIYCIVTYALGKTKMRRWKQWENETKTIKYQYSNGIAVIWFAVVLFLLTIPLCSAFKIFGSLQ